MKKIVVLTGAGISAESGIKTFRDAGGLWEGHDIMEVASPEGFRQNPKLVLDFYNQRRRQLHEVVPNAGYYALTELENDFDVHIITQNVDNLHEQAGSTNVLHLHGELFKARSSQHENYIIEWKHDLNWGDNDPNGYQLRPHIVWFGEAVLAIEEAATLTAQADIFIIVGTSMQVYPAAGLVHYTQPNVPIFYIDPKPAPLYEVRNKVELIAASATKGLPQLKEILLKNYR